MLLQRLRWRDLRLLDTNLRRPVFEKSTADDLPCTLRFQEEPFAGGGLGSGDQCSLRVWSDFVHPSRMTRGYRQWPNQWDWQNAHFMIPPRRPTKDRLATAGMVLAIGCAVITTGLVLLRELKGLAPLNPGPGTNEFQTLDRGAWAELARTGRRIGPDAAPITIAVLGDLECPACRHFHESALTPLLTRFPDEVAFVFHHWPLPYHRWAYFGARLTECAAEEGRFLQMLDAIYQHQDSLGRASAAFFAREAGIPVSGGFSDCANRQDSVETISQGIALAGRLGASGTPTIAINGRLLSYVPDSSRLFAYVTRLRRGP